MIKCRPPGNRDPLPERDPGLRGRISSRQIELIRPTVVATLGNFATKLLSGKPAASPRCTASRKRSCWAGTRWTLYPIFHPAAALYTPRMLEVLEAELRRLPELLGHAGSSIPRRKTGAPGALVPGGAARGSTRSNSASSNPSRQAPPGTGSRVPTRRTRAVKNAPSPPPSEPNPRQHAAFQLARPSPRGHVRREGLTLRQTRVSRV